MVCIKALPKVFGQVSLTASGFASVSSAVPREIVRWFALVLALVGLALLQLKIHVHRL
jgi:hypothetical protein